MMDAAQAADVLVGMVSTDMYVDSVLLVVYLYFLQAGRGSCFWNVEKVKKILHFYTHSNYLSFVKCHYIAIVYC